VCSLLREFDVRTVMCASFGGETGTVLRHLIRRAGIEVAAVETAGSNGGYVHDRRDGARREVARMATGPLSRHEVDDLYDVTLVEGLASAVTVLTGPQRDDPIPADVYRRLALDLRRNGRTVMADLSGERLEAALEGGLDVLKVSDEELERDGRLARAGSLPAALAELVDGGAANVVITRGGAPTLASVDGRLLQVTPPVLEAIEPKGAGDSFTAAMAAAIAHGRTMVDALALGAAAGALNVTRRGLATGRRDLIERLSIRVSIEAMPRDASGRDG
jgi:1-phosphofructokinase